MAVTALFFGAPTAHPVDQTRNLAKFLAPTQGVGQSGDMQVTANGTPNMSVNVAAGLCMVAGTELALTQGSYLVQNTATVNLTIAASDPTNPRNDLIVCRVQDKDYSGTVYTPSVQVITGTPAASPVDPALTPNTVVLARVVVAANAASIVAGNVTDLRVRASSKPWDSAWGEIGQARITASAAAATTPYSDVAGLSVTATVIAGRKIKVTCVHHFNKDANAGTCRSRIQEDGVSTAGSFAFLSANGFETRTLVARTTPAAGAHTWKLQVQSDANSVTPYADGINIALLVVEDIGPATAV